MKRIILSILVLSMVVTFTTAAFAQWRRTKTTTAPEEPRTLTADEIDSKEQESLGILNGRVWTIYLKLHGAKKPVVITDVLTFSGKSMVSQYLSGMGFKGSTYRLSIHPQEGYTIWETVQAGTEGASAAWRGDLLGDLLRGTLHLKNQRGIVERYDFSTNVPKDMPAQQSTQKSR